MRDACLHLPGEDAAAELGFRAENLERWLLGAAPGPAVILVASVYEAAAARLEADDFEELEVEF